MNNLITMTQYVHQVTALNVTAIYHLVKTRNCFEKEKKWMHLLNSFGPKTLHPEMMIIILSLTWIVWILDAVGLYKVTPYLFIVNVWQSLWKERIPIAAAIRRKDRLGVLIKESEDLFEINGLPKNPHSLHQLEVVSNGSGVASQKGNWHTAESWYVSHSHCVCFRYLQLMCCRIYAYMSSYQMLKLASLFCHGPML